MTQSVHGDVSRLLVEAMKVAELNHKYIAQNIANVDTPGYNAVELDFQRTLQSAIEGRGGFGLRTSHPRHFDFVDETPVFEDLAFSSKNDYNKVDVDDQMAKLSENTGKYTTYAMLLNNRFQRIREMLSDLRR